MLDFLSPVTDFAIISALDQELVDDVRGQEGKFELSLPEITGDRAATYKFSKLNVRSYFSDLTVAKYQQVLGNSLSDLTVESLNHHQVLAFEEDSAHAFSKWSVYKSLIGSVQFLEKRYALNEGIWYAVGEELKASADALFLDVCSAPDPIFIPLMRTQKGKGGQYLYQTEASYNEERADKSGLLLLDAKLVHIPEIPGSGVEVCDLLDIENKRLIHVKKSSRKSSVLSHFFKQGHNSARLLKTSSSFKAAFVKKVRDNYGDEKATFLQTQLNEEGWVVEYLIADTPRSTGEHNIPFFSKLTLRNEVINLKSMDFDVVLRFITLPAT